VCPYDIRSTQRRIEPTSRMIVGHGYVVMQVVMVLDR
jgi:hypothetical protein